MSHDTPHVSPTRRLRRAGLVFALGVVAIAANGIFSRVSHEKELRQEVLSDIPVVQVIAPDLGPAQQEVVLPGNVKPYNEAPIYARVNGYLKSWNTDIGTRVKAGQLLGQIETPELDEQIMRAEADVATAEANLELSSSTAKRWQNLLQSDSVSRQEVDEKTGDAKAKQTILNAARANLKGLRAQQSFNRIVAPFDGVVTDRKTDIGMLVNAGSNNGQALFKVADIHKLRTYVEVPQSMASLIKPNLTAQLHFPEQPTKSFPATLVNTSGAVNESSRTLTVQLQTDNAQSELMSGTYAEVHFKLPSKANVYRLPTSALIFRRNGLEVAIVGADNHVILKPITIARDLGNVVEVASGIDLNDRVIDSPSDSIAAGDVVRVSAGLHKEAKNGAKS